MMDLPVLEPAPVIAILAAIRILVVIAFLALIPFSLKKPPLSAPRAALSNK
jgi:hypothetical protein